MGDNLRERERPMVGLAELDARWPQETRALATAMEEWRAWHPAASRREIETVLDERLGALRARLLADLVPGDGALAVMSASAGGAGAEGLGEVVVERGLEYALHDGVSLRGDVYMPREEGRYPALLLIHGGGWQIGSPAVYQYWGPFLAERGYVAFAASYRLAKPERPTYPQAVHDVKAALQYLRGNASELKVDPDRIGAMGNSAGGHLSALLALSGDSPRYAGAYPDDRYASVSTRAKVAVPIYGVYDFMAQWEHDQLTRPRDQISEKFLGGSPMEIRDRYYEASPINWATIQNSGVPFLVVWGMEDDVVDAATQAVRFVTALKRAGTTTRIVPIPGAPHFWISETPVLEPGSYTAHLAPRLLHFLEEFL
jgi:acetyl esterase/lipase